MVIQTILLITLNLGVWGWHWWYLLFIPLFFVFFILYKRFVHYDKKIILTQEQEFLHRNSPVFNEMQQKLERILEKLNENISYHPHLQRRGNNRKNNRIGSVAKGWIRLGNSLL
jgi:hypothetical protein